MCAQLQKPDQLSRDRPHSTQKGWAMGCRPPYGTRKPSGRLWLGLIQAKAPVSSQGLVVLGWGALTPTAAPSKWVLSQPLYLKFCGPPPCQKLAGLSCWVCGPGTGSLSQPGADTWPLQGGGYDLNLFASPPDSNFVCSVCHGVLKRPARLPCSHIFCKKCILRWLARCQRVPKGLGGQE